MTTLAVLEKHSFLMPGGTRRAGYKIHCTECGAEDQMVSSKGCALPPDQAVKYFLRRGWDLGKRPTCEACARATRAANRKGKVIEMADRVFVKPVVEVPPIVHPEPPVDMGRDDRKIIFAKLSDVYVDQDAGYANGWSDAKVAKDLSVPRAWVEQVRDEFFGPVKGNEEAEALLAQVREIQGECSHILSHANKQHADMVEKARDLREKIDKLSTRLADLNRTAVEIERVLK